MSASTFVRLRQHAETQGVSACGWAERVITAALDAEGAPKVEREEALRVIAEPKAEQPRQPTMDAASGIFTF